MMDDDTELEVHETTDPEDIEKMQEVIAQKLEQLAKDLREGKIETIEAKLADEGGEIRFLYIDPEDIPPKSDLN